MSRAARLLIIILAITGCAKKATLPALPEIAINAESNICSDCRWHAVKIKINDRNENVRWQLDALLAAEIFRPILISNHSQITLWRFHRRAADDETGHQFSFKFYGNSALETQILTSVNSDQILARLIQAGMIQITSDKDEAQIALAETSDPAWPAELRATWPYFIMGVSSTWLELVSQTTKVTDSDRADLQTLIARYTESSRRVAEIWNQFGQHAFLHHLSAIMGYEPVRISKDLQF